MVKIEHESGTVNVHAPVYLCSTTEFTITTNKEDGSELQVIDETTHKVVKYCIAYNGYWNER